MLDLDCVSFSLFYSEASHSSLSLFFLLYFFITLIISHSLSVCLSVCLSVSVSLSLFVSHPIYLKLSLYHISPSFSLLISNLPSSLPTALFVFLSPSLPLSSPSRSFSLPLPLFLPPSPSLCFSLYFFQAVLILQLSLIFLYFSPTLPLPSLPTSLFAFFSPSLLKLILYHNPSTPAGLSLVSVSTKNEHLSRTNKK